jgi:luciferase family oxidoreductase group 1
MGFVPKGERAADVLQTIVRTAPIAECLGFSRFLLAEHYESHFAYSCPEIIIPAIGSITKKIRIGSAGVLLYLHSPLKIAGDFRALAALYPGRIDLGIGAGAGPCESLRLALRPDLNLETARETRVYEKKLQELIAFCRDEASPIDGNIRGPIPHKQQSPPLLLLGSGKGLGNMTLAARYGTAFCYSLYHSSPDSIDPAIIERYKDQFEPSTQAAEPEALVAATVLCAETDSEAVAALRLFRLHQPSIRPTIFGSPRRCADQIDALLRKFACSELILIPLCEGFADRIRGYETLANACRLKTIDSALEEHTSCK